MEFLTQSVHEVFPFIRHVIVNTYKPDVVLYTSPYQDPVRIDRGFRDMLCGNERDLANFPYQMFRKYLL